MKFAGMRLQGVMGSRNSFFYDYFLSFCAGVEMKHYNAGVADL